jgi:hypothetical protein
VSCCRQTAAIDQMARTCAAAPLSSLVCLSPERSFAWRSICPPPASMRTRTRTFDPCRTPRNARGLPNWVAVASSKNETSLQLSWRAKARAARRHGRTFVSFGRGRELPCVTPSFPPAPCWFPDHVRDHPRSLNPPPPTAEKILRRLNHPAKRSRK